MTLRPFEYVEPSTIEEAVRSLADAPHKAKFIAGGSDLLSEMKEGVVQPSPLVSLSGTEGLRTIEVSVDGLRIGAMATLAEMAGHPEVLKSYTVLAQAAGGIATPQIRNVGTLGGNLCQRPRCYYYRNPLTLCLKKGGDACLALAGNNKYLAVLGGERYYVVHPSDTAPALVALDAWLDISGPSGSRTIPAEQFFTSPSEDVARENKLGPNEMVVSAWIPSPSDNARSTYLKARERQTGDFALASAAVLLVTADGWISRAAIVLGGVAPYPYRARDAEEYLANQPVDGVDLEQVGGLALAGATPLRDNGYKVILASNLVKRAVTQLLAGEI